ncbi:unnamed protein product [Moneuplotes crassus]|uniref:SKP1-like protein n=1 Tax=Euplotes crassus TaxID=5936 RepID=A0AAD2D4I5_EUPCR|nr:unnamed protein product [Moneuplotes crassus]
MQKEGEILDKIVLISKEGERHEVEGEFRNMCNLVRESLEDMEDQNEIPLPIVPSQHIKWIIEYCQRHKFKESDEVKAPLASNKLEDILDDPKDIEFLESLSLDEKTDFMNNCDYLNIPSLVELLAISIASCFRCKDFNQIKEEFGVDGEFNEEEEEKLKKDYQWLLQTDGGNIEDFDMR